MRSGAEGPATSRAVPASAARPTRPPPGPGPGRGCMPALGTEMRQNIAVRGHAGGPLQPSRRPEVAHPGRTASSAPCRGAPGRQEEASRASSLGATSAHPPGSSVPCRPGPSQWAKRSAERRSRGCRICGKARFVQSWLPVGAGCLAGQGKRGRRGTRIRAALVTQRDG